MRFQVEKKKPTLCIYTDEEFVADKLEWEVTALRRELDGTRAALRLQAARCRHLVAAFSAQLQRQQCAARRERELRDEQLSRLLRALLVLDAGLRREQRNIRELLHQKDAVIHAQQLEIAMLREAGVDRTFGEGDGKDRIADCVRSQLQPSKSTAFVRFRKHSQKTVGTGKLKGEHPLVLGLDELQRRASVLREEIEDSYQDPEEEVPNRNLYEDYRHNPVLECVNQILLSDLEECEDKDRNHVPFKVPRRVDTEEPEETVTKHVHFDMRTKSGRYGDKEEAGEPEKKHVHFDVRTKSGRHGDNDEAETRHADEPEARHVHFEEGTKSDEDGDKHEPDTKYTVVSEPDTRHVHFEPRTKLDKHVDKEESKQKQENRKWQIKDKTPSPPAKEHLEEKACLMMSSQRLTLVRNVDLEEVDKKEEEVTKKSDASQQRRGAPPALPPKPAQLQLGSRGKKPNPSEKSDKPHQRKILSNGSLKYPLNLDHSIPENRQNGHHVHGNGMTFEDKIDELNISLLHANTPRGMAVMNGHVGKDSAKVADDKKNGKIRVGSSVSSLITGAAGDSIVSELSQGVATVSSMVRRFEDLGTCVEEDEEVETDEASDALRDNFEEFKLEDVDMDAVGQPGRPDGDGAETRLNGGAYENFLESTGLSQKSIMTPSRMLSNHRSVLKPKDIKHRSRLLKAAAITNHGGSIVKYWTEPFL